MAAAVVVAEEEEKVQSIQMVELWDSASSMDSRRYYQRRLATKNQGRSSGGREHQTQFGGSEEREIEREETPNKCCEL